MADSQTIHGKNAYIYVSGVAISWANTWNAAMTADTVEATQFGDAWKRKVVGQKDASGSISAWQWQDKRTLIDALGLTLPLYIYPDRSDTGNYFFGNVIFTGNPNEGSTSAAVSSNADWTSADQNGITAIGFA